MPCDQVRQTTVNLEKLSTANLTVVADALRQLGFGVVELAEGLTARKANETVTVNKQTGAINSTLRGYGQALDNDVLKVACSQQIIQRTAKKFGWTLDEVMGRKESKTPNAVFSVMATKRGM
jgi:hypothetical protein